MPGEGAGERPAGLPTVTMQVDAHALEGDDATAAETTATAIFGDPSTPTDTGRHPEPHGVTPPTGVKGVSNMQKRPRRSGGVSAILPDPGC